jgi:PAS domain S-box-containing protein
LIVNRQGIRREGKVAEKEPQEHQPFLSALIGNLPGMAYRRRGGPDGRMEYVSEGSVGLTGYQPRDLVESRRLAYDDVIHPDDRERVLGIIRRALAERQPFQATYRIVTASGHTRWVWDQGGPADNDGVEGFVTDVTERREDVEALRKSEAKLDSIFRSAPTGIGLVVDRVIREANQKLCEMTGYAREELIDRSARLLYPTGEEFDRVGRVKYSMIEDGVVGVVETRWRRKDGTIIDVLLSSAPVDRTDLSAGVTFTALDISRRKRSDDEIAWLASIVMSSDDAILSKRLDGTITSWNRGAEHVYGYRAAEVIGRPVDIIIPPGRRGELHDILARIGRGERIEHYETERLTRDGRLIVVSMTVSPIIDVAGQVTGASTIARDITEQKRAERALRKSQYILAKSQEMAHVGNWAWNLQTEEMNWSDEGFRIFGYLPQEITPGLDWLLSRVHPDDRGIVADFAAAAGREGRRDSVDYRIVRPDGTVRYVNTLLDKVVRDEAGRPKWAYGINQDITLRKQAEVKLRKSQYILAKSQEMAQVGNWAWNVQTGELNGSDENYSIFGFRPGEVRPTLEWALARAHPDDAGLLRDLMESARSAGKRGSVDYRIVRPDETVRYVNTLADKIVRDKTGQVRWVYGITQDVTERKHTEKALEEAKARAELYIDLMGHDINNMNQVALGYLELSLDDPGMGEETRRALGKSLESIRASSRLIHNVRKLQQVRTGERGQTEADVDGVLRQVRDACLRVPGSAAAIRYVPAATDCRVRANELLYDVFANIVENAIKHARQEPVVDIRLEKVEADGKKYCQVSVEDNGPGIPDDMKQGIFGRMRRGDTKAKGSGLGLYLVRTLVGSYGGRVWVEDRVPGDCSKGCRFVVLLPAV